MLLLAFLFVIYLYTFLHEGGHAVAALLSGNAVTAFDLNFFTLGAHVGIEGSFTQFQAVANSAAGVSLPIVVWVVFILLAPRRGNHLLEILKSFSAVMFLSPLLAWIVLPLLHAAGASIHDDSIEFVVRSGIHPAAVSAAAGILFAGGWLVFWKRIEGIRPEIERFRGIDRFAASPAETKTLIAAAAVFSISLL
ncbi:MAG: M50 family metallopeptidase [Anaerolineales bacterium]|nr:M50 family metallopeptidase [Anaerolineales bacterium]